MRSWRGDFITLGWGELKSGELEGFRAVLPRATLRENPFVMFPGVKTVNVLKSKIFNLVFLEKLRLPKS